VVRANPTPYIPVQAFAPNDDKTCSLVICASKSSSAARRSIPSALSPGLRRWPDRRSVSSGIIGLRSTSVRERWRFAARVAAGDRRAGRSGCRRVTSGRTRISNRCGFCSEAPSPCRGLEGSSDTRDYFLALIPPGRKFSRTHTSLLFSPVGIAICRPVGSMRGAP
jgi:hypothetical protein